MDIMQAILADPNVGQDFKTALPEHEMQLRRAAYVSMLRRHDWSHEMSDDAGAYRRGRQALEQLRQEQQTIDPDFNIWNRHCAERCKDGRAYA
jgi:hypothetical protein